MQDSDPDNTTTTAAAATPQTPLADGWVPLPLEHLPLPTYWPAGVGLAITFVFWGLITSWVVLTVGLFLFAASLAGWIADLRHERKHHPHH